MMVSTCNINNDAVLRRVKIPDNVSSSLVVLECLKLARSCGSQSSPKAGDGKNERIGEGLLCGDSPHRHRQALDTPTGGQTVADKIHVPNSID